MLNLSQIQSLVKPLTEYAEVIGLCLMGSYAAGDANESSDLDIGVFFQDKPINFPEINWPFAYDLWEVGSAERKLWSAQGGWRASAFLTAKVLYDYDGRASRYIEEIIEAKGYTVDARAGYWDNYLNGLYRSLKYNRKGVEYGYRACAAESVLAFTSALYFENRLVAPLPGRERASLWRLKNKPINDDNHQMDILTQILRDGSMKSQAELFSYVEPYMCTFGLKNIIDAWEGLIHLEIKRAENREWK